MKKKIQIFFSINLTQIFRICPKMFQFLTYLLHNQIIEMCHSQNLRRPLSVPCPTQWILKLPVSKQVKVRDYLWVETQVNSLLGHINVTFQCCRIGLDFVGQGTKLRNNTFQLWYSSPFQHILKLFYGTPCWKQSSP